DLRPSAAIPGSRDRCRKPRHDRCDTRRDESRTPVRSPSRRPRLRSPCRERARMPRRHARASGVGWENSALMNVEQTLLQAPVLEEGEPFHTGRPRGGGAGFLIVPLREERGALSAVERSAQSHEQAAEPLQARYYSALLPAGPPGPGEQYAFEVNLDRCSG